MNAWALFVSFSGQDAKPRDKAKGMKGIARIVVLMAFLNGAHAAEIQISDQQALEIGRRIWKNECAGTVSGLTSWNKSEEFPSLGIAHFIWYPAGNRGPFEESWPGLAGYLKKKGYAVPDWMLGSCPWKNRSEFMADLDGDRLSNLRKLLSQSVSDQARFAALRLEAALPKMSAAASPSLRSRVESNFRRVAAQPLGFYALMDYVNFKGEGVNASERYNGKGWGLLQVLETMPDSGPAMPEFVHAADEVLTQRVKNSPSARHEAQWLPGWRNRLQTYLK